MATSGALVDPHAGRPTPVNVVDGIQAYVEHLYDVQVGLRVMDYLIDEDVRRNLPGAQRQLPEQLFVRGASLEPAPRAAGPGADGGLAGDQVAGEDDVVEVALYLDRDLLALLAHDNPLVHLHPGNLEAFCIVAEGISHFVFLAWRLGNGLDVTALELELQAEVDKFCLCALLAARQQRGARDGLDAAGLWRQLFVAYELQPGLTAEESHRYHTASRAAARIAKTMLAGVRHQVRPDAVVQKARQWCRRSLAEKIRAPA